MRIPRAIFDAICRARTHFCHFIACLRCLILMLFVVAGGTFENHCLPSMLVFDAICGVPEHLAILLFAFDA